MMTAPSIDASHLYMRGTPPEARGNDQSRRHTGYPQRQLIRMWIHIHLVLKIIDAENTGVVRNKCNRNHQRDEPPGIGLYTLEQVAARRLVESGADMREYVTQYSGVSAARRQHAECHHESAFVPLAQRGPRPRLGAGYQSAKSLIALRNMRKEREMMSRMKPRQIVNP